MKTIFRFTGLAVMLSAVIGFSAASAAAQNACEDADAITALDAKIRENYPKIDTREVAVTAGKEFLEKYGECEPTKDFVAWLKPQLPKWEQQVADYKVYQWRAPRVKKFDDSIQAGRTSGNYDDAYSAGAELIQKYPDNMNFILPLGLIGLSESYKNNFKYNDQTVRYAQMALAKFKSGAAVESKKDKDGKPLLDKGGKELYGPFQFERNKEDAMSELTYALAYINYHAKKDKKAGLPYYYEVSQMPGLYKEEPRLYATIGSYYVEESDPIRKEVVDLINKQKAATTDEEKEKLEGEIKAKVALLNGYTERALDAFGRAYKFADEKIPAEKTLKAEVYKTLQGLYERRFEKKDGLDQWIATSVAKPLPNPTSEVAPVSDPEPAKTTTSTAPVTTAPAPNGKTTASATTPAQPAAAISKPVSNGKPAAANGKATAVTKPRR